ncbi:hypothetical protein [Nocardia sp. NPDC004604]
MVKYATAIRTGTASTEAMRSGGSMQPLDGRR